MLTKHQNLIKKLIIQSPKTEKKVQYYKLKHGDFLSYKFHLFCTLYFILYMIQKTMYTMYRLCSLYSRICTLYNVYTVIFTLQCTVDSVHYIHCINRTSLGVILCGTICETSASKDDVFLQIQGKV